MKYVRQTWPANYYTTSKDWALRQTSDELKYRLDANTPLDLKAIKPYQPLGTESQHSQDIDKKMIRDQLGPELARLRGHAFVDGDFDASLTSNNVILIRKFLDKPLKCWFRVLFPRRIFRELPATRPLKLRVFGAVTKPLGNDGFVDIAGVAVYSPED